MTTKTTVRPIVKRVREQPEKHILELPEVAVAAIVSYKRQKEVTDFILFVLETLQKNCTWLNALIGRQNSFKCVVMVGAGPNRFQIQEVIYPAGEKELSLELEINDSEDHDKMAIAALIRLSNLELDNLTKYVKARLYENTAIYEDLLKGKSVGVSFALLRAISERHYRVMERIAVGALKLEPYLPFKKRRKDEKFTNVSLKKTKKTSHDIMN